MIVKYSYDFILANFNRGPEQQAASQWRGRVIKDNYPYYEVETIGCPSEVQTLYIVDLDNGDD